MSARKALTPIVILAAGALALTGCSSTDTSEASSSGSTTANACSNADQVAQWPLKRRVTQLIMGGVNTEQGSQVVDQAITAVAKGRVTGVNFLGSNPSVYNNNELAAAVDAGGQVPPLLAIDQEGGQVQRLSNVIGFTESAQDMTVNMTPEQVQTKGRRIGKEMRKRSLNMDFAPVVDVGTRAIGDRTFSDDPEIVTEYAGAFAEGLRKAKIIPTLKHFPGLGSATGNTDFGAATTPSLSKLEKKDLLPYEYLLDQQPVAVMFANAEVPGLTGGKPASLSEAAYDLLRDGFGFDGVAITDSLSAAAISSDFDVPKAAEQAIIAGADIALWDDLTQAKAVRRQLLKAAKAGRLSEERINEATTRVLALKNVDLCVGR